MIALALWLIAIYVPIEWVHKSGHQIELSHGQICVTHWIVKDFMPEPGLHRTTRPAHTIQWAHDYAHTKYLHLFALPLWPLILLPAVPIALQWLRRIRKQSRINAGSCSNCGYELAGIPQSSPCPECFQKAPPAEREGFGVGDRQDASNPARQSPSP